MNMWSSLLPLALLMLGGTPSDGLPPMPSSGKKPSEGAIGVAWATGTEENIEDVDPLKWKLPSAVKELLKSGATLELYDPNKHGKLPGLNPIVTQVYEFKDGVPTPIVGHEAKLMELAADKSKIASESQVPAEKDQSKKTKVPAGKDQSKKPEVPEKKDESEGSEGNDDSVGSTGEVVSDGSDAEVVSEDSAGEDESEESAGEVVSEDSAGEVVSDGSSGKDTPDLTKVTETKTPVKIPTTTETRIPLQLYGPKNENELPALLRMLPGGERLHDPTKRVPGPLLLTNYIKRNFVALARQEARVKLGELTKIADSFAGYITVNSKFNSNLFFWYIRAKKNHATAPLILWLQGGPGASSMFGLFVEHGPFVVQKDLDVVAREITWAEDYNIVYVDQPVGTGFSFTDKVEGYATNQDEVADDLYEFLLQFFKLFPSLATTDFYIAGESYAGKYVPAISYKIHEMNKKEDTPFKINLKGLAIGDGVSDPVQQLKYADYLFQVGLVGEKDRGSLLTLSNKTEELIKQSKWGEAAEMFDWMMWFYRFKTDLSFEYNYLLQSMPQTFKYYPDFLNQPKIRRAIHVGDKPYTDTSQVVYDKMMDDIPKSVVKWVQTLLDSDYKVMIYHGQLDAIVPYPQTEKYISNLQWKGSDEYKGARRRFWGMKGEVAGYAMEVLNFRQVMVRNAGHMLPYDQPEWAQDMMRRFINGEPFGN